MTKITHVGIGLIVNHPFPVLPPGCSIEPGRRQLSLGDEILDSDREFYGGAWHPFTRDEMYYPPGCRVEDEDIFSRAIDERTSDGHKTESDVWNQI